MCKEDVVEKRGVYLRGVFINKCFGGEELGSCLVQTVKEYAVR